MKTIQPQAPEDLIISIPPNLIFRFFKEISEGSKQNMQKGAPANQPKFDITYSDKFKDFKDMMIAAVGFIMKKEAAERQSFIAAVKLLFPMLMLEASDNIVEKLQKLIEVFCWVWHNEPIDLEKEFLLACLTDIYQIANEIKLYLIELEANQGVDNRIQNYSRFSSNLANLGKIVDKSKGKAQRDPSSEVSYFEAWVIKNYYEAPKPPAKKGSRKSRSPSNEKGGSKSDEVDWSKQPIFEFKMKYLNIWLLVLLQGNVAEPEKWIEARMESLHLQEGIPSSELKKGTLDELLNFDDLVDQCTDILSDANSDLGLKMKSHLILMTILKLFIEISEAKNASNSGSIKSATSSFASAEFAVPAGPATVYSVNTILSTLLRHYLNEIVNTFVSSFRKSNIPEA